MVPAIEEGFFQREIGDASFRYQQAFEQGRKVMVGVNKYVEPEPDGPTIETLKIGQETEDAQVTSLRELKADRSGENVARTLKAVREACEKGENVMPSLMEAARAYATLGEMVNAMKDVYGEYVEAPVI